MNAGTAGVVALVDAGAAGLAKLKDGAGVLAGVVDAPAPKPANEKPAGFGVSGAAAAGAG